MSKEMIAVWFSCGAASAMAAKLTLDRYGATHDVRIVNNPVDDEDEDNQRFAADVSDWLGVPIEQATNPKFPTNSCVDVWERERFMSGPHGAPCTRLLKKEARYLWEAANRPDWHVLGFSLEEKARHDRFVLTERPNVLPVLIEAGMTKDGCGAYITRAGLTLPRVYEEGFPNANCPGCVKATSATYWNFIRQVRPEVFQQRAEQSRRLGARLVRHGGKRMFLDELPPDAKGRPIKTMRIECGLFCEEHDVPIAA